MNTAKHLLALLLLLLTASCQESIPTVQNNKIWLHRANTIEKARHFQYEYAGMEVDVHFDDSLQTFLIKHDADDTTILRLEDWCGAVETITDLGVWFDFKNLDAHNRDAALQCLQAIRERYHLNGKLYVESNAFNALTPFRSAGFHTSYYIPYFNPFTNDSATCYQHLPLIQGAIDSGVDAISGYEFQYLFMKDHFPNQKKLIWCVSQDSVYLKQIINNIGSDTLVDVLLLPNNTFTR